MLANSVFFFDNIVASALVVVENLVESECVASQHLCRSLSFRLYVVRA